MDGQEKRAPRLTRSARCRSYTDTRLEADYIFSAMRAALPDKSRK